MQWLLTIVITAFLIVPGVELLRLVLVDWMQVAEKVTLADACLVYILIVQTAILVQLIVWHRELQWERMAHHGASELQVARRRRQEPARRAAGSATGSPRVATRPARASSRRPSRNAR